MKQVYNKFIKANGKPDDAKNIGIFKNGTSLSGTIPLGTLSHSLGTKRYTFAVLSDIHRSIDDVNIGYTTNYDTQNDLKHALSFIKNNTDANFICACGDLSARGKNSELTNLVNVINTTYGYAVGGSGTIQDGHFYTCAGNHELYNRNWANSLYQSEYAGSDFNTSVNFPAAMNMQKYSVLTKGNDVFIFMSPDSFIMRNASNEIEKDYKLSTHLDRVYSDTDINNLVTTLKANKNKRCFIFTHFFFAGMAGNNYDNGTHYNFPMDAESERKLKLVLKKYPNAIWFSGHSHFIWETQALEEANCIPNKNCNVSRGFDGVDTGWCIHIPSNGQPRIPKYKNGGHGYDDETDGTVTSSQFGIVDVYDDYIVLKGLTWNGTTYKYLPIATYCLQTNNYVEADNNDIDFTPTSSVYCYYNSVTASDGKVRTGDGWLEQSGSKINVPQTGTQYTIRFMRYSNGDSAEMINGNGTEYSFREISSYNQSNDSYVSIRNVDYTFDSDGRMLVTFPSAGMYRIKCLWTKSDGAQVGIVLIITIS